MQFKLTTILLILFVFTTLSLSQSNIEMEKRKILDYNQEINVPQYTGKFNLNVQEGTHLFNTDYDYAGNTSIPNMLWPYDINGDGTWDPVGVAMQRLSTSEDGTRRVQGFFGVGDDITNLPISDPDIYTGWGHIQSITEGPLAGKAMVMMHVPPNEEIQYSQLDLASFNVLTRHTYIRILI